MQFTRLKLFISAGLLAVMLTPVFSFAQTPQQVGISGLSVVGSGIDTTYNQVYLVLNQPITGPANIPGFTLTINNTPREIQSASVLQSLYVEVAITPKGTPLKKTDVVKLSYTPGAAKIQATRNANWTLSGFSNLSVTNGTNNDTSCPALQPVLLEYSNGELAGYYSERLVSVFAAQNIGNVRINNSPISFGYGVAVGSNFAGSVTNGNSIPGFSATSNKVEIETTASVGFRDLNNNKVCVQTGEAARKNMILPGNTAPVSGTTTTNTGSNTNTQTPTETTAPTVVSFDSNYADGVYVPGQTMSVVAGLSEAVRPGSQVMVRLNTKVRRDLVLTADSANPNMLVGSFTITQNDIVKKLKVTRVISASVTDLAGNIATKVPGTTVRDNNFVGRNIQIVK